jgi:hypothetical protein
MRNFGALLVSAVGLVVAFDFPPKDESLIKRQHCGRGYHDDRTKWGHYDINTDYYKTTPDTGKTVEVFSLCYLLRIVLVDG